MSTKHLDLKAIFDEALEIESRSDRTAYLNQVCANDFALRDKVEALLLAHEQAGSFLQVPPAGMAATAELTPVAERPGTMVGNYKLLEQIGEGGMGLVYVAEQLMPIRRKVAVKIIKPGMDTREVGARFEAERQALALMDHPNIARVLDGGATDTGRPYFVMELVKGIPITDYCDQNKLTTHERLQLFVTVCQAIQHAHQKGVIHRDVKPSNVLVTLHDGVAVPKVIDFGVAKAINQQLTQQTIYTRFAQMIGTPLYMSPEQAELSGLDVDTRTDIYSLGVLLYELLTGVTPFDKQKLREAPYDEIRRIIREEEPPKPSTKISSLGQAATTVSANRRTEPKRLSQLVHGDLDCVVMKALEKDRTRRYATATDFAADVTRYLNDQPVEACPPSATYRFRKFARRNKSILSSVVTIAVLLTLGCAISTWQAIRASNAFRHARDERDWAVQAEQLALAHMKQANREKQRAEVEADIARATRNLMSVCWTDLLANEPDRERKVRDVLDGASNKIAGEVEGKPAVEAAIRMALAKMYLSIRDSEKARTHWQRSRRLLEELGNEHPMAQMLHEQGRALEGFLMLGTTLDPLRRRLEQLRSGSAAGETSGQHQRGDGVGGGTSQSQP